LIKANHVFLDVRKPHEWAEGVWPGALMIELSELEAQIDKIPKDKYIHVYCGAGLRARMGMHIVRNANVLGVVITTVGIKVVSE
jgi:rhodanese-related sulfurtransferase